MFIWQVVVEAKSVHIVQSAQSRLWKCLSSIRYVMIQLHVAGQRSSNDNVMMPA